MKNLKSIFILVSALIVLQACNSTALNSVTPKNDSDSASYMFGILVGQTLKAQKMEEVNTDLLIKGINQIMEGDTTVDPQEANSYLNQYFGKLAQKRAEENTEIGKKFLEENKTLSGVVETASGLQYKVIEEGTGKSPSATSTVKCHYRGRLLNGDEFDSSYKRGQPAEFGLSGVIPGWTEGLQLMKEGGKYELYVPGALGYGPRGGGPTIGPNETLIFEIELLEVVSE